MRQRTQATNKNTNITAKPTGRAKLPVTLATKSIETQTEEASLNPTLIDTVRSLSETLIKTTQHVEELQRELLMVQVETVKFNMQERSHLLPKDAEQPKSYAEVLNKQVRSMHSYEREWTSKFNNDYAQICKLEIDGKHGEALQSDTQINFSPGVCAQAFEPLLKWTRQREQQREQEENEKSLHKGKLEEMSRIIGVDAEPASRSSSE